MFLWFHFFYLKIVLNTFLVWFSSKVGRGASGNKMDVWSRIVTQHYCNPGTNIGIKFTNGTPTPSELLQINWIFFIVVLINVKLLNWLFTNLIVQCTFWKVNLLMFWLIIQKFPCNLCIVCFCAISAGKHWKRWNDIR